MPRADSALATDLHKLRLAPAAANHELAAVQQIVAPRWRTEVAQDEVLSHAFLELSHEEPPGVKEKSTTGKWTSQIVGGTSPPRTTSGRRQNPDQTTSCRFGFVQQGRDSSRHARCWRNPRRNLQITLRHSPCFTPERQCPQPIAQRFSRRKIAFPYHPIGDFFVPRSSL
jgi:hypothetical protein